jgi:hypothetical protein
MVSGVAPVINSVEFLLKKTFERLKLEEKLEIKQPGLDRQDINISPKHGMKINNGYMFAQKRNVAFCFPGLLFPSKCVHRTRGDIYIYIYTHIHTYTHTYNTI